MAEEQKTPDPDAIIRVRDLPAIVRSLATAMGEYSNARLAAEVTRLEARIAELESSVPRYAGVHDPDRQYAKGEIVTAHGGMWIALTVTQSTPPSDGWQLCCKGGRNGRDRFIEPAHPRIQ